MHENSFFKKNFKTAHVDDLTDNDVREDALAVTQTFSNIVDNLADKTDPQAIRDLMGLFRKLICNKVVPVGMVDGFTSTLAFYAEVNSGKIMGTVMCPNTWVGMVSEDPCLQMGAMVFVASQVRDFYNGKFKDVALKAIQAKKAAINYSADVRISDADASPIMLRAHAYEAEFLHWVKKSDPAHVFNEYQVKAMADCIGLGAMPPDLVYESLPFPRAF